MNSVMSATVALFTDQLVSDFKLQLVHTLIVFLQKTLYQLIRQRNTAFANHKKTVKMMSEGSSEEGPEY